MEAAAITGGWHHMAPPTVVVQIWHEIIGEFPQRLCAGFAVLRMGLPSDGLARRKRGTSSMLAITFAEAAGVAGHQKWGLVLSSSARVLQITYETVVGVRYPELVTFNRTDWNFGKFVTHEKPQRGGFLPVLGCSRCRHACS